MDRPQVVEEAQRSNQGAPVRGREILVPWRDNTGLVHCTVGHNIFRDTVLAGSDCSGDHCVPDSLLGRTRICATGRLFWKVTALLIFDRFKIQMRDDHAGAMGPGTLRMNSQKPLPHWIARLPLEKRRLFAWSAFVVMVLILPGAVAVLFILLQSNDCSEIRPGQIPFTCTARGLATIKIAMAAILFPPVIKFLWLFKRIVNSEDKDA